MFSFSGIFMIYDSKLIVVSPIGMAPKVSAAALIGGIEMHISFTLSSLQDRSSNFTYSQALFWTYKSEWL